MKNCKFKQVLSVGAISLLGLGAKNVANAQDVAYKPYLETRSHGKFINNKSQLVLNHIDTLQVYAIDTIVENGKQKIVCDLGPNRVNLICNFDYYRNHPWLPPMQQDDTTALIMALRDACLAEEYHIYDTQGEEQKRDSVEMLLLDNRQRFTKYAMDQQNHK